MAAIDEDAVLRDLAMAACVLLGTLWVVGEQACLQLLAICFWYHPPS